MLWGDRSPQRQKNKMRDYTVTAFLTARVVPQIEENLH